MLLLRLRNCYGLKLGVSIPHKFSHLQVCSASKPHKDEEVTTNKISPQPR